MEDFHNNFQQSSLLIKAGIFIFLVIVTIVYQISSRLYPNMDSRTLIDNIDIIPPDGGLPFAYRTIYSCLTNAFLSTLSLFLIILLRTGDINPISVIYNNFFLLSIVFIFMFLFSLSQETSGYNRYIARSDTEQGIGNYAFLDAVLPPPVNIDSQYINKEIGGDPFIVNIAYSCIIVLIIFSIIQMFLMLKYTNEGYNSGKCDINKSVYGITFMEQPLISFLLEIVILFILNGAGPILTTIIKNNKITNITYINSTMLGIMAVILHFMTQYTCSINFPVKNIININIIQILGIIIVICAVLKYYEKN
jgi:hypothetical protein